MNTKQLTGKPTGLRMQGPRPGAGRGYGGAGCGSAGSPRAQRRCLPWLGVAAIFALLFASGCTSTASPSKTPGRAWDNSEIIRAGRWAG